MATLDDARRIALSLPETTATVRFHGRQESLDVLSGGKPRGFAWVWMERLVPDKPRMPNPSVLAIRTADVDERDGLIAADPAKFFTEPHYNGFPAVLVRLANVDLGELEELLVDAWRTQAPKALVQQFDARGAT